jgi:hypothetical protein
VRVAASSISIAAAAIVVGCAGTASWSGCYEALDIRFCKRALRLDRGFPRLRSRDDSRFSRFRVNFIPICVTLDRGLGRGGRRRQRIRPFAVRYNSVLCSHKAPPLFYLPQFYG